jgi:uncharacterized protein YdaU (DUF1376 family)
MGKPERPPSFQFYPRDFRADPAVEAMTFDQRGRYVWALCASWLTDTPGVASEDQWRRWLGYGPRKWSAHRSTFESCFDTSRKDAWVQKRMAAEREAQKDRFMQASKGGANRATTMTSEERQESARMAALARWEKD